MQIWPSSKRIALWQDVKNKAYDLLSTNAVTINNISTYSILATVKGMHSVYECYVNNKATVTKDNSIDAANWYCTCNWGDWSNTGNRPNDGLYGSVKSNNRFCSHAYACYLMLQQYRKMRRSNAN